MLIMNISTPMVAAFYFITDYITGLVNIALKTASLPKWEELLRIFRFTELDSQGRSACRIRRTRSDIERGCIMERPKVIYNKKTGKFVMWFHLELKGQGYGPARAAVAVSDKPEGPYRFVRSGRVNPESIRRICLRQTGS